MRSASQNSHTVGMGPIKVGPIDAELEPRRPATTILLEQPVECPTDDLPWVQALIAVCPFRAATRGDLGGRPIAESPHEYVLRRMVASSCQRDFDRFLGLVSRLGYRGRFLSTTYRYLDCDGMRYWPSRGVFEPGVILNRASDLAVPPPPPELRLWEERTP